MKDDKQYRVYDYKSELKYGEEIQVQRSIYVDSNVDFSEYINLSKAELSNLLYESQKAESEIYDRLKNEIVVWDKVAYQTRLIEKAIEYQKVPEIEHTSNQWGQSGALKVRSNRVYKMYYRIYARTKYNTETKSSEPYAWDLAWSVLTNVGYRRPTAEIAGRNVTYKNKEQMEKYLKGRIKVYEHLFKEINPPVPLEYQEYFKCNGVLLPGYKLEDEKSKEKNRPKKKKDMCR